MTTFYLDFEGGNDGNDGLSFANRWKTITSGATSGRIAPGDTIRIMASRDLVNLGSCSWTNNSNAVTLASASTLKIWNGDAAWTGVSTDITTDTSTATPGVRIGSARGRLIPATAFTTGKMGYFTLPSTLDLSSYQQVSFWFVGRNSIQYTVQLCSDSTGNTPVHSISVTPNNTDAWQVVLWDNGSALSSSINSISIVAVTDPVTTAVTIQNMIACKAPSDSACVTHLSLIGKSSTGDSEFYPINTIDGTALVIGGHYGSIPVGVGGYYTERLYKGSTESVTTYASNPIVVTSQQTVQDFGTVSGGQITFSGGWNRTDMSTQTGHSWLSWSHSLAATAFGILLPSGGGITFSDISVVHAYYGFGRAITTNPTNQAVVIGTLKHIAGCYSGLRYESQNYGRGLFYVDYITNNRHGVVMEAKFQSHLLVVKRITGSTDTTVGGFAAQATYGQRIRVVGKGGSGSIDNNKYAGAFRSGTGGNGLVEFRDFTFSNNDSYDVYIDAAEQPLWHFFNCSLTSGTPVGISGAYGFARVHMTNVAGSSTDHRVYGAYFTLFSESSVRHTASGLAWKLSPTSTVIDSSYPATFPLGSIYVTSGTLVTVKCWLRRTNTGLTVGLLVPAYSIGGITTDQTSAMTAAADTWEEVTFTFTPTDAGVVEIQGYAYGGTTYSAYFDDMTVTQA